MLWHCKRDIGEKRWSPETIAGYHPWGNVVCSLFQSPDSPRDHECTQERLWCTSFFTCVVRCTISHVIRKFHNTTMARFKLKRRLEHGWTGHLATISAIKNWYQDLLDLLEFVGSYCKSSGEDVAEAIGYSLQIKSLWFVITLATIKVVLLIFKPINAMLQTKTMDVETTSLTRSCHSADPRKTRRWNIF